MSDHVIEAIGVTLRAGMEGLNVKLTITRNPAYSNMPPQIFIAPSEARELAEALNKFAAIGVEGGNDE